MDDGGMIATGTTESLERFLDADVGRMKLVVANLANVDTPGYQTRDLDFQAELARAGSEADGMYSEVSYVPHAPVARRVRGLIERPDGNNVSVERESLALAETQMKYNLAVQLLKDQFHTLSQSINSGGGTSS